MKLFTPVKFTFLCLGMFSSQTFAQGSASPLWTEQEQHSVNVQSKGNQAEALINIKAKNSRLLLVNINALNKQLKSSQLQLELPLPNGQLVTFKLQQNSVLPSLLSAKYPTIKTFTGVQVGNLKNTGRFDFSSKGFHGAFNHNGETVYIDPQQRGNNELYLSYFKKDALPLTSISSDSTKQAGKKQITAELNALAAKTNGLSSINKRYRIAFSTSAEYSVFHGNTKEQVLSAIVTLVNRMNAVFSRDLAVEFELAENSDAVIFLAPQNPDGSYDFSQDPFDNTDNGVYENPAVAEQYIGSENYDIGHLLTTGAGGLAGVGVICENDEFIDGGVNYGGPWKAVGVTGSEAPTNDSFYIDFVAHELGHQLGAEHSFNSLSGACSGNRWAASAYEPGSGSTIMAYTGICAQTNLQTNSDDYFHVNSIIEMRDYLINSPYGNSCGIPAESLNQPPVVDAGTDNVIPANTPFTLTAQATDIDNDTVYYTWEQSDLGTASFDPETMVDDGNRPIFRSIKPNIDSSRTFPQFSSLLTGELVNGENYPTTTRALNFKVTARDEQGGVAVDAVLVNVLADAGPFALTEPVNNDFWSEQAQSLVRWDVANTNDINGVNCQYVDIEFSANGGQSFDFILATATENDGEQIINTPVVNSKTARLKITCTDNVFFALSAKDFEVFNSTAENIAPVIVAQHPLAVYEDNELTITLADLVIVDADNKFPEQFSLSVSAADHYSVIENTIIVDENFNGELAVPVTVNDGEDDSDSYMLTITVLAVNDVPVAIDDNYSVAYQSTSTMLDVLVNDSDVDSNDTLSIASVAYNGQGTVTINNNQLSYTPAANYSGSEVFTYQVADSQGARSSAQVMITVAAKHNSDSGGGTFTWLNIFAFMLLCWRANSSMTARSVLDRTKEKFPFT